MSERINKKIKLLWNEIREHLKYKRNNSSNNYWYPMHNELFKQKCFAIKILKGVK